MSFGYSEGDSTSLSVFRLKRDRHFCTNPSFFFFLREPREYFPNCLPSVSTDHLLVCFANMVILFCVLVQTDDCSDEPVQQQGANSKKSNFALVTALVEQQFLTCFGYELGRGRLVFLKQSTCLSRAAHLNDYVYCNDVRLL